MEKYIPPFEINHKMLTLVSLIMEKVGQINAFEHLDKYPKLRKQNRLQSIHGSLAIEANSLSFDQVIDVVNGVTVLGPKKDILEVQNALVAYQKIEKINPLNEEHLQQIHQILGKDVIPQAGKYRHGDEGVIDEHGRVIFIAPPPDLVPSLMQSLFAWIKANYQKINPLILSSVFHYEFVFIHPFRDGNGRMARLWQNALLGKWKPLFYWLPLESLIEKHQGDYYQAISDSHRDGKSNTFIVFMLKMINLTLEQVLSAVDVQENNHSIYLKKLLQVMEKGRWYTAQELLHLLNLKSRETLRRNYLHPAMQNGLVDYEFPKTPTSRNQRYQRK